MRSIAARSCQSAAFTIVELIVVITVIVLILGIAVPGLSAISAQSRLNAATQTINGALLRAYYAALADVNMTAVRFMPGEWDNSPTAEAQRPAGRQHLVTYSYASTSAANPNDFNKIVFGEYFQRRARSESLDLPDDIYVAPLEALDTTPRAVGGQNYPDFGKDFVLTGTRGHFELNAADSTLNFLKADDFLITFDSQTGLRGGLPTPAKLKAYVPADYPDGSIQGRETDRSSDQSSFYQRYSFSGLVIYRRGTFVTLGDDASAAQARQDWLRANGRPYLVHRYGGGLVMGTQGTQ